MEPRSYLSFFFFFFRKSLCIVYIIVRALCEIRLRQGHAWYRVTGVTGNFRKLDYLEKIRISGFQELYDLHSRRILNFDIYASHPLAKTVLTCRHPLKLSKVNIHHSSPYHDQDKPKYLLTYLTFKWSNENGTQKLPLFFFFFFFRIKNRLIVYTVLRPMSRKWLIRAGIPTGLE